MLAPCVTCAHYGALYFFLKNCHVVIGRIKCIIYISDDACANVMHVHCGITMHAAYCMNMYTCKSWDVFCWEGNSERNSNKRCASIHFRITSDKTAKF